LSFGNVERYGAGNEAETIAAKAKAWKKGAIMRLLSGRQVSESDGYFLTVDAEAIAR
jgi:hypothetical protein